MANKQLRLLFPDPAPNNSRYHDHPKNEMKGPSLCSNGPSGNHVNVEANYFFGPGIGACSVIGWPWMITAPPSQQPPLPQGTSCTSHLCSHSSHLRSLTYRSLRERTCPHFPQDVQPSPQST